MASRAAPLLVLLLLALSACEDDDLPPVVEVGGRGGPAGIEPAEWGSLLFADHGCSACHGVSGTAGVGGPVHRIWGRTRELEGGGSARVDEEYLRRSILDPNADVVAGYEPSMPSYRGELSEPQVDALVAFLKQLR